MRRQGVTIPVIDVHNIADFHIALDDRPAGGLVLKVSGVGRSVVSKHGCAADLVIFTRNCCQRDVTGGQVAILQDRIVDEQLYIVCVN